jgi:hypothetical protein
MYLRIKLLLLLLLWCIAPAAAQNNPVQKDSVKEKRDAMYKSIQDYSKRSKFTKFVHKLIFKPVKEKKPSNNRKKEKQRTPEMQDDFLSVEGKIIRNIKIQTLDPFGYSISDTTRLPDNWLENFGNSIHLKTKEFTIRNLLLFKKNERLDSLLVQESERLIRSQRYTRRVDIKPIPIANNKDSVDVYIRVLDSWSLIPNGSASGTGTRLEVTERNFFGLGHEFENDFDKRFNTGQTSYLARYRVPNIVNTYIDAEIIYQIWQSDNSLKSVGVQRQFFSPFTRWAGGVYMEERLVRDSLPDMQGVWAMHNRKSEAQDYWAGYSFKIFKGFTEEDRTTNLVTTGRYFSQSFKERPSAVYDSINFYSDEKLYLASVGVTSRKFVQDKYLFNYDIVEDIPIGKLYSITFGRQDKNFEHRLYLGARYAFGNLYKWGYLSANAEVGSFLYNEELQQTVFRLDMLYFSNVRDWGNWRFRHFIKPALVLGYNRMPIIKDQLNLNGTTGITGFDSRTTLGTKKLMLTFQTQSYSPWNLSGFRLNPFASFTMGVIGNDHHDLYKSRIYSKIGLGLLIYNDYLVFNSFQLSVAFFPYIPGQGYNIFQTNTLKNDDIILPNYQIGKPVTVPYE